MPYINHLHVHSHFSILDGMSKVPDLIKKCKQNGMYAMALTDHGNMFGIKELVDVSNKVNKKNSDEIKFMENMKELLALYKNVTGNYRPLLDGERYLTDREVSEILKVSRRTLQEYRNDGVLPYILLGGKVLYRENDLEKVLESCYHPAR